MAQWKSGMLITSKKFPSYYLRLPYTGKKHQITFVSSQWHFTSLICIQPSELRPILNSTPCRINKSIIDKTPSIFGFRSFWLKNSDLTACWSGLGSDYSISWFWESILSGTVIDSQTFLGRKSRKIWNRDLSKSFKLFDVSYYKGVQLSLTWIFECFNCFRKSMQLKINATNLRNLML